MPQIGQLVTRRTRPGSQQAPVAKPEVIQQRVRRVRPVATSEAPTAQKQTIVPQDKARMEALLKSISNTQQEQEALARKAAAAQEELFRLMKMYKLPLLEDENLIAEVYRPRGRGTNTIDPRAFQEQVPEDDFYACISVSITKAREVLPGKALEKITESEPGKLGDETLKLTRKETK